MTGLDATWKWYQDAKQLLLAVRRQATGRWDDQSRDKWLRTRQQAEVVEDTTAVLDLYDRRGQFLRALDTSASPSESG